MGVYKTVHHDTSGLIWQSNTYTNYSGIDGFLRNRNVNTCILWLGYNNTFRQQFREFMVSLFRRDLEWGLAFFVFLVYFRTVTE